MKELIKEAETVEEAVALAAAELGVSADELTVEVVQEPQKKTMSKKSQRNLGLVLMPQRLCL